ncbi:MAG: type II secretion system F family protein [Verrucomicrobiota bacterium]
MPFIVTPGQLARRAELYHQLGATLTAGIPLIKALEMVSADPRVRISRKTIFELIDCLQNGMTFGQSLEQVQGWLPEFDIALLATGEKTGRLDVSFKLLSVYNSSRAKIIRDTIAGLIVTIATLHVFLLVFPLGYLIEFAQGIASGDYARCLPFLIEKCVAFGVLYGGVFFLIFACQGNRGESWRALVEGIFGRIPLLRSAQKYLVLARLSAALQALVMAGISIVSGWELAAGASGSPYLRRQIAGWKTRLESGTTPAELVTETRYFPEMFANLYNTGEQSGQLDDTLERLHNYYQEEGFRALRLFSRVMNGTIYGALVVMVAFNVIRFWVNYYGNIMTSF